MFILSETSSSSPGRFCLALQGLEASMAPLQLHVWRAFIAFFGSVLQEWWCNVYDVHDVYESNVIMWYELPYTIYHICCLSFHVLHLQNASYILYRRSPHPSVPGWEKTSCKPADGGATLFGSNFGERWRSLWVFLGCLRSKSWEIQTFFIPNFQLMKIQQAPFSKALSCVEYGDLWPVRMP